MAESSAQFDRWLHDVGEQYQKFSSSQCDQVLDHLIDISQSSQLYHLSEVLTGLLKRDFIAYLPREISYQILEGLDAETLLISCQVSSQWRDVVESCTEAWRRVCQQAGLSTADDNHDALYWKNRYERCSRRLKALETGEGFHHKMLFGHTDRVMAVYYNNGLLATGSDDHSVRIWNCASGQCIKIIQTHTVAELKFNTEYVFTASFDTTAACWDFKSGQLQHRYAGHVAAVFSVDYCTDLDLVITGSADSTVKVWILSSGQLIQTLPHHRSNWIMQVRLVAGDEDYYILSRDNISIHQWQMSRCKHTHVHMEEWQRPHNDLVPGLQVRGCKVAYAGVDSDNICYIMENDMKLRLHGKQRISHSLHRDSYAQAFLGCGSHYDVVLTQGDKVSLDIIRHSDQALIASARLPSDYRQSKRMSTFSLAERGWLDGFDGTNDEGVLFVTSLRDNSILLLEWTPLCENTEQS